MWQTARSKRRRIAFMNGPCLGAGAAMALRYTSRTWSLEVSCQRASDSPVLQMVTHLTVDISYGFQYILSASQNLTNKQNPGAQNKTKPCILGRVFCAEFLCRFFFCGSFFFGAPGCFISMYEVIDSGIQPKSVLVIVCEIRQRAAAVGVYVNRFRLLQ